MVVIEGGERAKACRQTFAVDRTADLYVMGIAAKYQICFYA